MVVRRVEIGGWSIVVEYDPELEDFGQWCYDKWVIKIGPRAAGCFRDSLRHEMRHAAFTIGGVSYNERMEEESIVRCLETIFDPAWEKIEHHFL